MKLTRRALLIGPVALCASALPGFAFGVRSGPRHPLSAPAISSHEHTYTMPADTTLVFKQSVAPFGWTKQRQLNKNHIVATKD